MRKRGSMRLPATPNWLRERGSITLDFSHTKEMPTAEAVQKQASTPEQQKQLINDVLLCMRGICGENVAPRPLKEQSPREFSVNNLLEPMYRDMLNDIKPLFSGYSNIVRFIEENMAFRASVVCQAVAGAMLKIIEDYFVVISQLEHQQKMGLLTLHKLWYHLQSSLSMFKILSPLVDSLKELDEADCKTASVLSLLHDKVVKNLGDKRTYELCMYLLQSACVPFFQQTEDWIYNGDLDDFSSDEFMVEEEESSCVDKHGILSKANEDFWEKHYRLHRDRIPQFLEVYADKILNAGKYLNAIRLCGKDIEVDRQRLAYTVSGQKEAFTQIDRAYAFASQQLLDVLKNDFHLIDRLRSVKLFYLQDCGDYMLQFMDFAAEDLAFPLGDVLPHRLNALLGMAIETSVTSNDAYFDSVSIKLVPYRLVAFLFHILKVKKDGTEVEDEYSLKASGLKCFEAISLKYAVNWPLSLLLNNDTFARYEILFRHFTFCKYVERQLCMTWRMLRKSDGFIARESHQTGLHTFALIQRMLNFVQNMEHYMSWQVFETNFVTMEKKIETSVNVDEATQLHKFFLDNSLTQLMLTDSFLTRTMYKMLNMCLVLCSFILKLTDATDLEMVEDGIAEFNDTLDETFLQLHISDSSPIKKQVEEKESFRSTLKRLDTNFTTLMLHLLDKITSMSSEKRVNSKLLEILARLDFSFYYNNLGCQVSATDKL